jgi:hypothetical protein
MNRIETLVEKTEGGYSYDRYANWTGCIKALIKVGFTDEQVEAIMLSKWTRWAADAGGKRYGAATAKDLLTFIDKQGKGEVVKLTAEHFGQ